MSLSVFFFSRHETMILEEEERQFAGEELELTVCCESHMASFANEGSFARMS